MKYLIDTCVLSELVKKQPCACVLAWIEEHEESAMALSVLTFGELTKGVARLPDSRRKTRLQQWVDHDLRDRFANRILPLDTEVCRIWGRMQARAERSGQTMPVIDGLIAATGLAFELTVVTRNISDMAPGGGALCNPWEY